ncbi:hypothetical protein C8R45DRAFT_1069157 [Mycena sanguinolenta]|nr:hypothetical protein C8R45DRAFT_1069157 [Mycena sanguinolenta]
MLKYLSLLNNSIRCIPAPDSAFGSDSTHSTSTQLPTRQLRGATGLRYSEPLESFTNGPRLTGNPPPIYRDYPPPQYYCNNYSSYKYLPVDHWTWRRSNCHKCFKFQRGPAHQAMQQRGGPAHQAALVMPGQFVLPEIKSKLAYIAFANGSAKICEKMKREFLFSSATDKQYENNHQLPNLLRRRRQERQGACKLTLTYAPSSGATAPPATFRARPRYVLGWQFRLGFGDEIIWHSIMRDGARPSGGQTVDVVGSCGAATRRSMVKRVRSPSLMQILTGFASNHLIGISQACVSTSTAAVGGVREIRETGYATRGGMMSLPLCWKGRGMGVEGRACAGCMGCKDKPPYLDPATAKGGYRGIGSALRGPAWHWEIWESMACANQTSAIHDETAPNLGEGSITVSEDRGESHLDWEEAEKA